MILISRVTTWGTNISLKTTLRTSPTTCPTLFETATRCSTSTEPQVIKGERNWEKFYRKYETTWNMKWMEKNCNVISKRKNNSKFDWFELTFYFSLLFVQPFIHFSSSVPVDVRQSGWSFIEELFDVRRWWRYDGWWTGCGCECWPLDWTEPMTMMMMMMTNEVMGGKRGEERAEEGRRRILNGEWHWHWLEIWDSRNIFY